LQVDVAARRWCHDGDPVLCANLVVRDKLLDSGRIGSRVDLRSDTGRVLTALEKSSGALGNAAISEVVEGIREEVRRGRPMAELMEDSEYFPDILVNMIAVGEETGRLDELLVTAADQMDDEVDYTVRNLSTLLEPALLSVIFGMVLFLAMALFLPMWDMVKLAR